MFLSWENLHKLFYSLYIILNIIENTQHIWWWYLLFLIIEIKLKFLYRSLQSRPSPGSLVEYSVMKDVRSKAHFWGNWMFTWKREPVIWCKMVPVSWPSLAGVQQDFHLKKCFFEILLKLWWTPPVWEIFPIV